jgi:hypothetical protein
MRARALPMLLLLLSAPASCARAPEAPDRTGRSCDTDADCNRGAAADASACGYLVLCVAGRCEVDAGAGARPVVCERPAQR